MRKSGYILAINPGSTTTKLAIYQFNLPEKHVKLIKEVNLDHTDKSGDPGTWELSNEDIRTQAVRNLLRMSISFLISSWPEVLLCDPSKGVYTLWTQKCLRILLQPNIRSMPATWQL